MERQYTVLDPSIRPLVRGDLPDDLFQRVMEGFPSSSDPASERLRLSPVFKGISKALYVKDINDNIVAVLKIHQNELGSKRQQGVDGCEVGPRRGCTPGSGAFVELLAYQCIKTWLGALEMDHPVKDLCVVPKSSYFQMGHPMFSACLEKIISDQPSPSIRGTGILQEYIPECSACDDESIHEVNPLLLEYVAAFHIALLHSDGHEGNILIQRSPLAKRIVMIDFAYSLSSEGLDGGRYCWLHWDVLNRSPSEQIRKFIEGMDDFVLERTVSELKRELSESISQLSPDLQRGEIPPFEYDRIVPHMISLCFLKEAMKRGWTLSQIGNACHTIPEPDLFCSSGGLIHDLYLEIKENNPGFFHTMTREELKEKIQQLCIREASKDPATFTKYKDAVKRYQFATNFDGLESREASKSRELADVSRRLESPLE